MLLQAAAVFGGLNDLSMFARSLKSLISTSRLDTVPANHVARDQLCFFANSLQMDMPTPPPVHGMKSWSVLTPYYSEDVVKLTRTLARSDMPLISMFADIFRQATGHHHRR